MATISIFDCGCVPSRPKNSLCKSYGTRWKVFSTPQHIILACRDCGRRHYFELRRAGVQITKFESVEDLKCDEPPIEEEKKDGIVNEPKRPGKMRQLPVQPTEM